MQQLLLSNFLPYTSTWSTAVASRTARQLKVKLLETGFDFSVEGVLDAIKDVGSVYTLLAHMNLSREQYKCLAGALEAIRENARLVAAAETWSVVWSDEDNCTFTIVAPQGQAYKAEVLSPWKVTKVKWCEGITPCEFEIVGPDGQTYETVIANNDPSSFDLACLGGEYVEPQWLIALAAGG